MFYKPKKSRQIYDWIIAHRGYHKNCPENSLTAYQNAINFGLAIELDIRILADDNIICFHDRNLKRLTKINKKVNDVELTEIKILSLEPTHEKIPTLKEALMLIDSKVPVLIEIKGFFNLNFRKELIKIMDEYEGVYYFHVKNIIAYFRAKKIWKDKVFWIINLFRKRFNFIKFRLVH
ncbi:MAG: glycerophosphodiester phosphodiesterase family protein [Clostridia bacterium]|nr:glycerophosphodiester phosphodiesterase family protein [Clostridia bacterium]